MLTNGQNLALKILIGQELGILAKIHTDDCYLLLKKFPLPVYKLHELQKFADVVHQHIIENHLEEAAKDILKEIISSPLFNS